MFVTAVCFLFLIIKFGLRMRIKNSPQWLSYVPYNFQSWENLILNQEMIRFVIPDTR